MPFWNMQGDVMIDAAAGEFVRKVQLGISKGLVVPT
jgi:hypothetical protein